MITASVHNNGDVEYRCTQCKKFELVEMSIERQAVWFVTNGAAVLRMLRHFMLEHKRHRIEVHDG